MSHELRTPLNSLLILSKMLQDNPEANLTDKQVEYAKTIHGSGPTSSNSSTRSSTSPRSSPAPWPWTSATWPSSDLAEFTERTFRHVAEQKKLGFQIKTDSHLARAIRTDGKRLQQVIKNLLSERLQVHRAGAKSS